MEKLKKFSEKLHKLILKNLVKKFLIFAVNQKFFDNKLKKFLWNLSESYKENLHRVFKLWKIKCLKLEKIGLLKYLGGKLVAKRSQLLWRVQLKKYFEIYRTKVKNLKFLEFFLEKIAYGYKKKNFEFFKLRILLKDSTRKKLIKVFKLLKNRSSLSLQKKYFNTWLKLTWNDKINLAMKINIRNRLFNLNRIRNSKDYLLKKHFEIWLEKFDLKLKFRSNFLKRNKAALKLINLLRKAKAKNKILKSRKIKNFLFRKIEKIQNFKFFNLLKYFIKWKSG